MNQQALPQTALPYPLIEIEPKTAVISKPALIQDDRLIEERFR